MTSLAFAWATLERIPPAQNEDPAIANVLKEGRERSHTIRGGAGVGFRLPRNRQPDSIENDKSSRKCYRK